ncbi:MAG: hypothetical protein L3J16_07475, partial [Anaerolineales bacterium]|nr:hypothetical protein [Anaerolineales bacterium]
MKVNFLHKNRSDHLIPWITICVALAMLALTPLWAWHEAQEPFLGMLLEPNNVVSQINGKGWPAREQGAVWSDQLIALNGQAVTSTADVRTVLHENGFAPLTATFKKRSDGQFTLRLTPVRLPPADLLTLFVIPYLVGLIFLAAGLWAYRIRSDLRASRAFVTFAAALSVTTVTFWDMNTSHHAVLLWTLSLAIAAGALINLALVFPREIPIIARWPAGRYLPATLTLLVGLPAARQIVAPTSPYAYIDKWIASYALIAFSIILFIVALVIRVARSHSAIIRQQSRIIVFGAALAFFPALLLYLLPIAQGRVIPEFRPSLYFSPMVLLPISVTYAIVRYRLLDVDRFLSRALTYLLTTAAAFGVFYGLLTLASMLIQRTVQPSNPLVIAAYLLLLMFGLNPIRNLIQRAIDRVFYRSPADYRRVLTSLSKQLVITPNLVQTLHILETELFQALAPERFIVYLYNDEQSEYLPHASHEDNAPPYAADDPLIGLVQGMPAP